MSAYDAFLGAFALVAQLDNVLALALGVVVGVIVGAVPGMSATMAVALALPFTFTLDPIVGILMLIGVYKGGIYGGSIPAILIKTPGTPASSCTVLDGHPMAERGEAGKALEMSLYASCIADMISNLSLILFAAWLAAFALSFGPPEYFTLILFSLTIIAGVAGDTLLKGLISAGFGLLLATVGLDLVYGTDRFIFGEADLMSGLNFIPVLIGLFAIPEVLLQCTRGDDEIGRVARLGRSHVTLAEMRRCLRSIFKSSLIGVLMGAIPGIGGAPAAFMAYGEARRSSPNAANFGRGELEGVAASEAGNNGVCGATMIPLLALGIPGDVITAVILGAFMVHGLQPGPLLFQQNIVVVYAIFIGIMLSSVFLFATGMIAIRAFRRVADIPKSILLPAVLTLCVFGAYAVNNTMFDVAVMFATGLFGYFMVRVGMPAAPFLIAFILGPMLEDNFRQGMLMGQSDFSIFFRSPITWFFWALTAATVALLVWQGRKGRIVPAG
ncbi:MAG: tripartite tricarboxylate transporter permease [Geminicoccaceae bacterium]|nr:tripartite tricarboxylate transporter permease [Geminicoccaceae bacterium]